MWTNSKYLRWQYNGNHRQQGFVPVKTLSIKTGGKLD